jgi:Methyltransferase domain
MGRMANIRDRIRRLLSAVNLAPSRHRPFLSRRYPYQGGRRMLKALGPDLSAETTWAASIPTAPDGELASIFADTDNIHKWLHYLPVYESALAAFRSRPIRMLEIGVARGGSLQMWRRYLNPESVVVGVDIDPACRRHDTPSQRVHVRIGAQQDVPFLRDVAAEFGPFDVILDDGSHMTSHMVATFRYLFPHALADGGIYIVEDNMATYWKGYRDSAMSFIDFTGWLVDAMHAHYQVTGSELDFRVGDPHCRCEVTVPLATTLLEKVEFHDSIVVVHRAWGRRELPRSVYR